MGIKQWYGLAGLSSLLRFVGVFIGERYFLDFLAFAVGSQYFFTRTDEMQGGQILRSAARGFSMGIGVTTAGTLLFLVLDGGTTEALYLSSGPGWGAGVAVYALPSSLCGCREWQNARA